MANFEYTPNPVWIALQSVSVFDDVRTRMFQVFAKYYANCIAGKIISRNPKLKIYSKWHDDKSVSSNDE
jgi:hypothetical protein